MLKYFPPVIFQLKSNKRFELTYSGAILPEQTEVMPWDNVTNFKYVNGIGGDVLHIVHPEKGWLGAKTTKVKLPGIKKERERFKALLVHYWRRHKIMRQHMLSKAQAQAI